MKFLRYWHHPVAIGEYLVYNTDIILRVKTKETRLGQNLDGTRNNTLGIESKKFTMVKKKKKRQKLEYKLERHFYCAFFLEKSEGG